MTTRTQLSRHHRRYHRDPNIITCSKAYNKLQTGKDSPMERPVQEEERIGEKVSLSQIEDVFMSSDNDKVQEIFYDTKSYPLRRSDLNFNNEKCNNYFLEETAGFGNAYLCGYAHFHLRNISNKLNEEEVELDLKIAYLSSQLSVEQRHLFSEIINGIIEKENKKYCQSESENLQTNSTSHHLYKSGINNKNVDKNDFQYEIPLPRNKNDIRKYYIESKYSICDNLPIPCIQNLTNHAYISPIDIIRNILGHGLPLDKIQDSVSDNKGYFNTNNVSMISQSAHCKKILENAKKRFTNNQNTLVL